MQNITLIRRRFPRRQRSLVTLLFALSGSAMLIGLGLMFLF